MGILKKSIIVTAFAAISLHAFTQRVVTCIVPRSQGFNAALIWPGWEFVTHCADKKEQTYYTFALIPELTRSFRPERINQCLFGDDIITRTCDQTEWNDVLMISGSETENRTRNKDWLADYFGLPTDFQSAVHFKPRVNNFICHAHLFIALNTIKQGLYFQFELPFVYSNWDLNMCEIVIEPGINNYEPGYFNPTGIARNQLLSRFTDFISGAAAPTGTDLIFQPLTNSKMNTKHMKMIRCAELRAYLGYDFFIRDVHHFGLSIEAAAPCGNRQKGEFLFEPFVGNGHHWELGIGCTGHFFAWERDVTYERIDLFLNANITHLFGSHQKRTYDLKIKPNSRYMLAQKMGTPILDNLTGNGVSPIAQFKNELSPIANLTTFNVSVSNTIQAEVALMFAYTQRNITWSFGYSAWKRTCDTINILNPNSFPNDTWAIKGDAHLFGFIGQANPTGLAIGTPVALSPTESGATINTGTNMASQGLRTDPTQQAMQIAQARRNPHIDFPQNAFAGNNQRLVASLDDLTATNQIETSIQPRLLTFADIDTTSARTSGFVNKLFGHVNRVWHDTTRATPYLGFGAEVDFGKQAGLAPAVGDDTCLNCQFSYWGIWIKGGALF